MESCQSLAQQGKHLPLFFHILEFITEDLFDNFQLFLYTLLDVPYLNFLIETTRNHCATVATHCKGGDFFLMGKGSIDASTFYEVQDPNLAIRASCNDMFAVWHKFGSGKGERFACHRSNAIARFTIP